jgi:ribosome biogenesis GTPase A
VRHAELVIEVRDARLPLGSANFELEGLGDRRALARLVVFTKADLADPQSTQAWERYFATHGLPCLFLDAANEGNTQKVMRRARELSREAQQKFQRRGIRPPAPRIIVVGIPNVGKSTLINRILHRKRLRTGPQPGVTRETLWVPIKGEVQLMDSPGILLPRIETEIEAQRLALIGAFPAHLLGTEDLAKALLTMLLALAPEPLRRFYRIPEGTLQIQPDPLSDIARSRGFLTPGAGLDLPRAAEQVLRDFRDGSLGRITLESPPPI